MSMPRFERGSFMTERERSTNWAIKHWQLGYSKKIIMKFIISPEFLLKVNGLMEPFTGLVQKCRNIVDSSSQVRALQLQSPNKKC
jgi:hypothetical protein